MYRHVCDTRTTVAQCPPGSMIHTSDTMVAGCTWEPERLVVPTPLRAVMIPRRGVVVTGRLVQTEQKTVVGRPGAAVRSRLVATPLCPTRAGPRGRALVPGRRA